MMNVKTKAKTCLAGMSMIAGLTAGLTGTNGLASETETDTHRLPDLVVHPEHNVLLAPTRESPALEPSRLEMSSGDLQRIKPVTASDALKAAPGIHTETRGRKYKQFHSFRGQVYPYPDVAFDGIWHRDARELFYVYPGAAIEKVDIIRSASTLFYGLADIVGVINIVAHQPSLDPETPPVIRLGAEGGSYGAVRGFGMGSFRPAEHTAFNFGSQYYRTDGRSGRNAAEELTSAFGSLVYQPSQEHSLHLGAWLLHGYRELEMPDPDGPAQNSLKNRRERYDPLTYGHLHLRGFHHWSHDATTQWTLFYSDRQARYIRNKIDPDGPGPGDTRENEDDREYGAQIVQGLALSDVNTLRLGLFAHRWTAPNGKHSYVGSRQDVSSFALVLADEHRIQNWTLDAGIRYARSYFHDFSGPDFSITGQSTRMAPVENEWDDQVFSGTLGAAVAVNEANRLYLHGGSGARRTGPGALRPDGSTPSSEQRYTADAGWLLSWGPEGDGRLKLGGFGVWRRKAVVRINETGTDAKGNEFYFSDNSDLRQGGLEIEMQSPSLWEGRLYWTGGLTWMRSEIKSGGGYDKYSEIPSLILSSALHATAGLWDSSLAVKYVDDYENFRFAQDGAYHDLGGYWDLSLSGGVRLRRDSDTRFYAAVDNVLNEEYSTVVGWSDAGRRFRVGLETSF